MKVKYFIPFLGIFLLLGADTSKIKGEWIPIYGIYTALYFGLIGILLI